MSETQDIDAIVQQKYDQINNRHFFGDTKIDSQQFTLFPNYVETKVGNVKKAISLLDFKGILDGMLNTEAKLDHFALPFNCYTFAKSGAEIQLGCYHPERIAEVSHIDRSTGRAKKYKIPFPNTIVSLKLSIRDNFWNVSDTKYFCTNKKVTQLPDSRLVTEVDPSNGIWIMPFPNFYGDGRMCFGRNSMPTRYASNLRGLDYFYQVLFDSAFNDDLGLNSVDSTRSPSKWFQELSQLTAFPYEKLRK